MPRRSSSKPSGRNRSRPPRRRSRSQSKREQPKKPQLKTARDGVFQLLEGYRKTGKLIRDQLKQLDLPPQISSQAATWTERLILRQRTIDRIVSHLVERGIDKVEPELVTLLRMGANELMFGPAESQHAAISETVELCRVWGQARWSGFINGVLRSLQRLLTDETTQQMASNAYPLRDGNFRVLKEDLFPDPVGQSPTYIAIAFSLPDASLREWRRRYSPEVVEQLAWASLQPSPLAVRVNRLATTVEEWLAACQELDIEPTPTESPESFLIEPALPISQIPGFDQGEFVIQDFTATHAARLLNPYPGENVLDLCAGPGTKTTHLAELMLDRGTLVACEVSESRISQIEQNKERLNLTCLSTQLIERENPQIEGGPFDAILIDAPCSNTGVWAKRAEARWRYSIDELHALNKIQQQLLDTAIELLSEEGRIVYSTCSIEPKENETLIERWLKEHPEFECVESKMALPNGKHDGGYCARIERV